MPAGKKAVHDLFSTKIASKRVRRREAGLEASLKRQQALKDGKPDPSIPESVDNFAKAKSLFGPHKIKTKEVEVVKREVSPSEGKPTVNAKSAEQLIHKPGSGKVEIDPTVGAIPPQKKKSKRGNKNGQKSRKSSRSS